MDAKIAVLFLCLQQKNITIADQSLYLVIDPFKGFLCSRRENNQKFCSVSYRSKSKPNRTPFNMSAQIKYDFKFASKSVFQNEKRKQNLKIQTLVDYL